MKPLSTLISFSLGLSLGLTLGLTTSSECAIADVQFEAAVDQSEVALDDSVTLKMTVKVDGNETIGSPTYQAPDFVELNQFENNFLQSVFENGKFTTQNTRESVRVLRPKELGKFTIKGFEVMVGGKTYRANMIQINVTGGGSQTLPPAQYGGAGVGLRGAGKGRGGRSTPVFLKAEVDKREVVQGEQIIVSYYLYRKSRVYNLQVDKYPSLPGSLREDLEMPVLGQRLPSETVTVDGAVYDRSLLVRYAVYPLKEGRFTVDPMTVRASYYSGKGFEDEEDLLLQPFMNLFQSMTPQVASISSEPLPLEVKPLPTVGRPASFSGGVGDFEVSATVDRTEVKAGEAVSWTVRVVGQGNLASVELPKLNLPDALEVYESKGRSRSGKGGLGEKVFEVLLIPRTEGQWTLPGLAFGFYDPKQGYVEKKVTPLTLTVVGNSPRQAGGSSASTNGATSVTGRDGAENSGDGLLSKLDLTGSGQFGDSRFSKWTRALLTLATLIALLAAAIWFGFLVRFGLRRMREKQAALVLKPILTDAERWKQWYRRAEEPLSGPGAEELLNEVTDAILDAVSARVGEDCRGFAWNHIESVLEATGVPGERLASKLRQVVERIEKVGFGRRGGFISDAEVKRELPEIVREARDLCLSLKTS